MVIILSPSKTISKISLNPEPKPSQPIFTEKALALVERMRKFSVDNLQELMSISPPLARLTFERSEERRGGQQCRNRWSPYH